MEKPMGREAGGGSGDEKLILRPHVPPRSNSTEMESTLFATLDEAYGSISEWVN